MEEETNWRICPNCGYLFLAEEFETLHCDCCGWNGNDYNDEEVDDIDFGNLGWPYDGTDDGER